MNHDPYQPPAAPESRAAEGQLSEAAARQLLGTQGWARFVSVLMFMVAAFMLFRILGNQERPGSGDPHSSGSGETRFLLTGLVLGIGTCAFVLYPAVLLGRYATAIRRYRRSASMADVEQALRQQRLLWYTMGIAAITAAVLSIIARMLASFGFQFWD